MFKQVILQGLNGQKHVRTILAPKWTCLLRRAPIIALPAGVTLAALAATKTVDCTPSKNSYDYDSCSCQTKASSCEDTAPAAAATLSTKLDKDSFGSDWFNKHLHYIQYEAPCEQKAATIGGAFLLGQALSFRKRFLRKSINGAILATIVAAVIYPEEAKRLFHDSYDKVKGVVSQGGKSDDKGGKDR